MILFLYCFYIFHGYYRQDKTSRICFSSATSGSRTFSSDFVFFYGNSHDRVLRLLRMNDIDKDVIISRKLIKDSFEHFPVQIFAAASSDPSLLTRSLKMKRRIQSKPQSSPSRPRSRSKSRSRSILDIQSVQNRFTRLLCLIFNSYFLHLSDIFSR